MKRLDFRQIPCDACRVMQNVWLQRMAWGALVSVLMLIFVGAIVRVTGAGMGCPDWPTCWGKMVPPTKVEDVDFSKLDIEKFRRKAEKMGRDPEKISVELLRAEFNARHVWTEFINRCFSLPVGIFSLGLVAAAFFARKNRILLLGLSIICLLLVLINAWMGARVVYSGLSPGVLTKHMALAFLLILLQTVVLWLAYGRSWTQPTGQGNSGTLKGMAWLLLVVLVVEGLMGTQIREVTDSLSKHQSVPRSEWGEILESTILYLMHRSFSWVIFLIVGLIVWQLFRHKCSCNAAGKWVVCLTLLQMILGLIMSQVHVFGAVQVLHVGFAAVMIAASLAWCLSFQGQSTYLQGSD